eukprot:CAMPEP_0177624378 /NCGR_PEP_ID=MMETSP0419_2-20121207/29459_1 /TAXON_ID=582737 /ORGANISM="Tetraselmis sp., Strain GSL018" /LENGTH=219 /DNA_ID=CAMNT_0019125103 /DNA_START=812 /DNA_END=1469 /DNA_ORIENTATION=-
MQDHNSGRSRGFGFVTFDSEDSVGRVFRAGNMQMLAGKKVEVKNATPRGSGSPQPGASKGSGRGPSAGKTQMQRATMPQVGFEVQGAVPYGMMGYGVGYGVGGYGMGFPAPYGVYGGMMMGYGYDPGYHGGFPYGVPYLPHQDSTGDPAFASGDPQAFGAEGITPTRGEDSSQCRPLAVGGGVAESSWSMPVGCHRAAMDTTAAAPKEEKLVQQSEAAA